MTHPLVKQLRFTRREFARALRTVEPDDAVKRLLPLNSLSWSLGHLAWQEQKYFLYYGQGEMPYPEVDKRFRSRAPASTPPLDEMWAVWRDVTKRTDPWLDSLDTFKLQQPYTRKDGKPGGRVIGNLLQRVVYHYWYHTGENMALRMLLGHGGLPQFVGNIDEQAPYEPEPQAISPTT